MATSLHLSTVQVVATSFGALSIIYAVRALVSPSAFAVGFGFPPDSPALSKPKDPAARNPFITATGGRTLGLGLSILIFTLRGDLRASGTVVSCCVVSGLCDVVSCYLANKPNAVVQHGIGTTLLGALGWWLLEEGA